MENRIGIVGGDLRQYYLIPVLNYPVTFFANNKIKQKNSATECNQLSELLDQSNIILVPIPFSKDKNTIYTLDSNEEIVIDSFVSKLTHKHFIIGGPFSQKVIDKIKSKGAKIFDLTSLETFKLRNAIPTSEGVLSEMIVQSNISIYKSRVFLLGFGNCGKRLSKILSNMGAQVEIYTEDEFEQKKAKIYGFETKTEVPDLGSYDFIVNTIPKKIIKQFNPKYNLMIDITDAYNFLSEKFIKMRGIPGKYSPKTSGIVIGELVNEVLKSMIGENKN